MCGNHEWEIGIEKQLADLYNRVELLEDPPKSKLLELPNSAKKNVEAELSASDGIIKPCSNEECGSYNFDQRDGSNCMSFDFDELEDRCNDYRA